MFLLNSKKCEESDADDKPVEKHVRPTLSRNATRVSTDMTGFYKNMKKNVGINNFLSGPKSFTKTNSAF